MWLGSHYLFSIVCGGAVITGFYCVRPLIICLVLCLVWQCLLVWDCVGGSVFTVLIMCFVGQ